MGLDAPRVLMLELAERVAADTLLRATPGAPRGPDRYSTLSPYAGRWCPGQNKGMARNCAGPEQTSLSSGSSRSP